MFHAVPHDMTFSLPEVVGDLCGISRESFVKKACKVWIRKMRLLYVYYNVDYCRYLSFQ